MSRIEKLRRIVAESQHAVVDGQQVDLLTARAILACYDAASQRTQHIIETAPILKVAEVAWKIVRC